MLFIPVVPIILSFAWGELSGLLLSCTLIGLWELLREPLQELFSHKPYGSVLHRLKPYKFYFLWAFLLIILYWFIILMGTIHPVPAWVGFFCFAIIEIVSFAEVKKTSQKRSLFAPIIILPVVKKRVFCFSMAAFACAVLAAVVFRIFSPGSFFQADNKRADYTLYLPTASEYEAHMAYQSSFSYLPLGININAGEYVSYHLGEDGLIAGTGKAGIIAGWEIPPFPLEKLTEFLLDYSNRPEGSSPVSKELISMVLILLACIPLRQKAGDGRSKTIKDSVVRYKRIAA
jgi:hypothetical protein